MFLGIVFIVIGLFLSLNAIGVITGNFWGFFWAIFFLVIGFRMMMKKGKCPMCGFGFWQGKIHDKIHANMHDHCCNHKHEHGEEEDGK